MDQTHYKTLVERNEEKVIDKLLTARIFPVPVSITLKHAEIIVFKEKDFRDVVNENIFYNIERMKISLIAL